MAKGKKAVEITETVLRDAHQSLIATMRQQSSSSYCRKA